MEDLMIKPLSINVFFESSDRDDSIKDTIEKILYVPIHKRIWTKIKNKIKRILY